MTNKRVNWLVTDGNITVNYDGETHIVKRTDPLADRLLKAVKENKFDEIPTLVSAAKRVESFSHGAFTVKDGRVHVNGIVAAQVLSDKIVKFANEGLPFQPLLKFAEKLGQNPSYRAVNELYGFLEKNDHPITSDGNFIAFKRVRSDFKDIYSGTFDNSPGQVLEMPRNQVDEDCTRTCSNGFHVANWEYAHTQYGSKTGTDDVMLEVEVNPADVVAVPVDYSNSKMRVSKYKVLGVVTTPFEPTELLRTSHDDQSYKIEDDEDHDEYCEACGEYFCRGECEEVCQNCGEIDCDGDCDVCRLCRKDDCFDEACSSKTPYEY